MKNISSSCFEHGDYKIYLWNKIIIYVICSITCSSIHYYWKKHSINLELTHVLYILQPKQTQVLCGFTDHLQLMLKFSVMESYSNIFKKILLKTKTKHERICTFLDFSWPYKKTSQNSSWGATCWRSDTLFNSDNTTHVYGIICGYLYLFRYTQMLRVL